MVKTENFMITPTEDIVRICMHYLCKFFGMGLRKYAVLENYSFTVLGISVTLVYRAMTNERYSDRYADMRNNVTIASVTLYSSI